MRDTFRRLASVTIIQAIAEVVGLLLIALAGWEVFRPLGIALVGVTLVLIGNVRLAR